MSNIKQSKTWNRAGFLRKKKKYSRTEAYVRKYPSNNKQNKSKTKFQQIPLSKQIIFWKTNFITKTQNEYYKQIKRK